MGRAGVCVGGHARGGGAAGARELLVEDLKREEDDISQKYCASQKAHVNACDEKLKLAEVEVLRAGGGFR